MLKFSLKVRQVKQTIQNWIIYRSSYYSFIYNQNRDRNKRAESEIVTCQLLSRVRTSPFTNGNSSTHTPIQAYKRNKKNKQMNRELNTDYSYSNNWTGRNVSFNQFSKTMIRVIINNTQRLLKTKAKLSLFVWVSSMSI